MKNLLRVMVVLAMWALGLLAGFKLLFTIGPQLACAADPICARAGDRWWHTPLILGVALGPGTLATILWWKSRRRVG